ncbi:SRPBCC family protein, partial [Flavobacterium sp.]|uniref:SRPBCC family protein n=1 Tax=Flavobacterium sp. TaxID=239 RepID=UPI0040474EB6
MDTLLYIILVVILLIIILANIAPGKYDISRSISIKKPLPEVFSYLKLLKNQDNWSPWAEKDPNMKKTFSGVDGEIGFVSSWVGNKEVGEGAQEITGIINNEA